MKIYFNHKVLNASNICPIEKPNSGVIKKFIKEHGVEAFVTSQKYGKYAACYIGDIQDGGGQVTVETENDAGPEIASVETESPQNVQRDLNPDITMPIIESDGE